MRHVVIVAVAATVLLSVSRLSAQETNKGKEGKPQMTPEQQEMMKKWAQISTPTDAHKKLDGLVGTWDAEVKIWSQGPGSEPSVTRGTSVNAWVLGGRYLQQQFKGEMMGMPFEGIGYTGYDNYNKKYTGFWIDNSTTQMSTMSGVADRSGTMFTLYGSMDEWMTGENGKTVKYVSRIINNDKNTFEVHDLSIDGPNNKMMEITYTRKK